VAGEKAIFRIFFSGLSADSERRANCTTEFSILDSNSVVRINQMEYMSGLYVSSNGCFPGVVWWQLDTKTGPGHYTARFVVKDNITNRTSSRDMAITIIDNDMFALGEIALFNDRGGNVPAGPSVAIGDTVHAQCGVYLPKKASGHAVDATVSFLSAKRNELARVAAQIGKEATVAASATSHPDTNGAPVISQAFVPNRPGSYVIRLEAKDQTTHETVAKETCFNVYPPPKNKKGEEQKRE
jgi:hypothetical protein